MKKLLTIITTILLLVVNSDASMYVYKGNWAFANEPKKEFCDSISTKIYSSKMRYDKDLCKKQGFDYSTSLGASQKYYNEIYNAEVGSLSSEFLKKTGVGLKLTKDWGNIGVNYEKFLCTLNDKEKEQLMIFFLSSVSNSTIFKKNPREQVFLSVNSIRKNISYVNGRAFIDILINKKKYYDDKVFAPFFKYVLLNEFEKARDYIIKVNKENRTTEYYNEIKTLCKNKNLKDVADILEYPELNK